MRHALFFVGGGLYLALLFLFGGCGGAGLTPEQQQTATAQAAFATFAALPPTDQQATQTIVFATINAGLDK